MSALRTARPRGAAVVSGASSGIGSAIVAKLLADGWSVIGLSRSPVDGHGERFRSLQVDMSDFAQLRAALAAIDTAPETPVLALVDWNMPVMNGLEFVRAVRGRADLAGVTLMMVTTESEMSQVAVALEAGANEYLMKPFDRETLHIKLQLVGVA